MRGLKNIIYLAVSTMCWMPLASVAEELSVSVKKPSSDLSLGVDAEISVVVSHAAETTVVMDTPDSDARAPLYIKSVSQTRKNNSENSNQTTFALRLVPLAIGEFRLPKTIVRKEGLGTDGLIKVDFPLLNVNGPSWPQDALPAPKAFSSALSTTIPSLWPFFVLLLCVLSGGALGVKLIRDRLRRRVDLEQQDDKPVAHVDPWGIALEELRLTENRFLDPSTLKTFYMGVSETLRRFLGRKYDYSTLDLTTKELCVSLEPKIEDEKTLGVIKKWLQTCDLVKYAKKDSDIENAKHLVIEIKRWIEATRPRATENA